MSYDADALTMIGCTVKISAIPKKTYLAKTKLVDDFHPRTGKFIGKVQVVVEEEREVYVCPVCKQEFETDEYGDNSELAILDHLEDHFDAEWIEIHDDSITDYFVEPRDVDNTKIESVVNAWKKGRYTKLYQALSKAGLKPKKPAIRSILAEYY